MLLGHCFMKPLKWKGCSQPPPLYSRSLPPSPSPRTPSPHARTLEGGVPFRHCLTKSPGCLNGGVFTPLLKILASQPPPPQSPLPPRSPPQQLPTLDYHPHDSHHHHPPRHNPTHSRPLPPYPQPPRRLLALLHKDERTAKLGPLHTVLEKMYATAPPVGTPEGSMPPNFLFFFLAFFMYEFILKIFIIVIIFSIFMVTLFLKKSGRGMSGFMTSPSCHHGECLSEHERGGKSPVWAAKKYRKGSEFSILFWMFPPHSVAAGMCIFCHLSPNFSQNSDRPPPAPFPTSNSEAPQPPTPPLSPMQAHGPDPAPGGGTAARALLMAEGTPTPGRPEGCKRQPTGSSSAAQLLTRSQPVWEWTGESGPSRLPSQTIPLQVRNPGWELFTRGGTIHRSFFHFQ